jgi:cobyrinic acid a,c-diamide synthase
VIPRVVIAATGSGVGKTTVACGLIGALRRAGHTVQGFKVGPDYIDPSYHRLASGRPGRNLDAFLSGPELIAPLFRHGAAGADLAVIEGVMGMFDGASGRGELASTAHVAKLLAAPVILVVDGSAMARSVAAVVHGFRTFDPEVDVAGVIVNRVGSAGHEQLVREAITELPVLGVLGRDERLATPERHLGLIPATERAAEALERIAAAVAEQVDLAAVERLARDAPPLAGPAWSPISPARIPPPEAGPPLNAGAPPQAAAPLPPAAPGRRTARIAIARGPAFSFHYEENLELLRAAGAELVDLDPLAQEALPEGTDGLILAGGFPEVYGAQLAANAALRAEIAAFAAAGRPVLAECGGLLYLARELDGHEMCGVLPVRARMGRRLTLGYREAEAVGPLPWLDPGERVRGHEFHYSQTETPADAPVAAAWRLSARGVAREEGVVAGTVQASYLHVHWAAHPAIPARFVAAAGGAG